MDYPDYDKTDISWTTMKYIDSVDELHSQPFSVKDKPVQLRAFGLTEGEYLCLYLFDGGGCNVDPCSEPAFDDCGKEVCLCCENSNIFVTLPGDYILVKKGVIGTPTVKRREVSRGMVK